MDSAVAQAPAPQAQAAARSGQGLVFLGVLTCFLLSGFAALVYQTAWMRQFSIVFGTSELAVATVLAAYMGGLALGSAVAGRLAHRIRRPVLAYGLLELGIAVGALAVPYGLALARSAQTAIIGGQAEPPSAGALSQSLFYLVVTFAVIAVPTGFMGATLPILTRQAVSKNEQVGPRIGLLYAINTAGAVAGALIAAFVLLPRLGLTQTVWVGVAANALIFLVALLMSSALRSGTSIAPAPTAGTSDHGRRWWILPLILVSGITSFTYEVLWTRLLAHVLDGSIYAFATMLASFLTGITLGSAVAARFAKTQRAATTGFIIAQLGTAAFSIAVYLSLDRIPEWVGEDAIGRVKMSMAVLLPPTLFIGATFPFALRVFANDERDAGLASGKVYAWNTVGAILGAVLAGFVLIPGLGFHGAIRFAVGMNLLIALGAAFLYEDARRAPRLVLAVISLAVIAGFRAQPPEQLLRTSPMHGMESEGKTVFQAVGRSASVLMLEHQGAYQLRTNGLPEADILPEGSVSLSRNNQVLLTVLPCFARPRAKTLLSIGFGGGVLLERVPPNIEWIDAVELEPEVILANKFVSSVRDVDPFDDPRLHVIENDARSALALTDKTYDIIVSQPSHPWTAGASHLYTREFIGQAKQHLNEEGVFLQWMSASFVTEELFKILGSTLLASFDNVRLYRPDPFFLLFIGSDSPLEVERQMLESGVPFQDPVLLATFAHIGFQSVEDVAVTLALDDASLRAVCDGAPVNTDDRNFLAMRSRANLDNAITVERLNELLSEHDPLVLGNTGFHDGLPRALDRSYMTPRLASRGLVARGFALLSTIKDSVRQNIAAARLLNLGGDEAGSARSLSAAVGMEVDGDSIRLGTDDPDVVFAYLREEIYQVAGGTASAHSLEVARALPDPYLAVIEAAGNEALDDWGAVANLDGRLALARPQHECYIEAVQLRASWRSKVAAPEHRAKYAHEAVLLMDQALAITPQVSAFQIRILAGNAADRPDVVIETFSALAQYLITTKVPLQSAETEQIQTLFRQALAYFPTVAEHPRVRPNRISDLTALIEQLLSNP